MREEAYEQLLELFQGQDEEEEEEEFDEDLPFCPETESPTPEPTLAPSPKPAPDYILVKVVGSKGKGGDPQYVYYAPGDPSAQIVYAQPYTASKGKGKRRTTEDVPKKYLR